MFGRKKKFSAARIDTLIGQGTEISGDLVFSGGLHVDGHIKGNVVAEEGSTAILILSEHGKIEGEVRVPLMVLNGEIFGQPNAGVDMTFHFPTLIAHAAKTRPLAAGSIIGSGTVSNLDRSAGSSCLAERRMLETIEQGEPKTPFMRFGDRVRIEMLDQNNRSVFGAIDQQVVKHER